MESLTVLAAMAVQEQAAALMESPPIMRVAVVVDMDG